VEWQLARGASHYKLEFSSLNFSVLTEIVDQSVLQWEADFIDILPDRVQLSSATSTAVVSELRRRRIPPPGSNQLSSRVVKNETNEGALFLVDLDAEC
jgi:hypothetical protein